MKELSFIAVGAVALGGALGAVGRFLAGRALLHHLPNVSLPLGTLSVNLLGCFLIGAVAAYLASLEPNRMGLQLLLITGFLGGFTTFSAFGFETLLLLRRGDLMLASVNVFGSILCCLAPISFHPVSH